VFVVISLAIFVVTLSLSLSVIGSLCYHLSVVTSLKSPVCHISLSSPLHSACILGLQPCCQPCKLHPATSKPEEVGGIDSCACVWGGTNLRST
jgi:hypothetical protein